MEVDILISSSLDKISSPCNLPTAIGVPPGAKLRLFRDPVREGQSRMAVCCDKRTASRLRHRFSAPRMYTHDGQLLSLTFVGIRPIVDRRHPSEPLPRGLHSSGVAATAPQEQGGLAAGVGRGAERPSRARVLPPPSSSSGAGVEFALEWVDQAEADGPCVPGISNLYDEFMRIRKQCSDGEEKSREFSEDNEFATNSAATTIQNGPPQRHRWWSGKKKGDDEEEKKGEEEKHSSVT